MTIKSLTINSSYQRLVQAMGVAIFVLLALYIYFVASIVLDAAGREKTLSQAGDLSSQVSTLEAQYVSLSGKVTMELATNLGFAEAGNQSGFAMAQLNLASNSN